jgi:hypothetical protein
MKPVSSRPHHRPVSLLPAIEQFPYETCRIHVDRSLHGRHDRGLARTDAREMSGHR